MRPPPVARDLWGALYTRTMPRVLKLLLLAALLLLPACGATRHPEVGHPTDFALGITVLADRDAPRQPRHRRPAQYLLEPDGTLRVAVGAGVEPSTYPPRVRRLSRPQVERLWTLVDAAAYNADHPAVLSDPLAFRPTPRDGWALIDVTADGQRHHLGLQIDQDPSAQRLIDELAALSWIR